MQRSCGYALRPTLRIDEIERVRSCKGGPGSGGLAAAAAQAGCPQDLPSPACLPASLTATAACLPCLPRWQAVKAIKAQRPDVIVAVDNCYGEFTDTQEPPAVRRS